ncbi:chitin binding protein [Lasiosphaeria hispida]|uniref:Chitin binding protein n=1 Tax=Lasiosphaeria hispida TaxID=260671 RepID=A0AAJ0M8L0_9PEZI|nr:chitin binding protein [Lasiosphaeria hispida]
MRSLASVLAVLPVALSCSYPPQAVIEERQITKRDVRAGGKCGSQGGNAACAADLCCSEEGACGIGGYFCVAPGCQLNFGPACDGNKTPPGNDTSGLPRPLFGDVPYGVDVSRCTVPGKVAITFDDGPNKFTNELLDVLKKNDAKATFFVVGANSGKGQIEDPSTGLPATIMRMHIEGHQIGSHSWSHQDFNLISSQQRRDQLVKNEIALVDILGFLPTYFRPPFTKWNDDVLADLKKFGYHNVNFDLDTQDWKGDYQVARDSFSSAVSQKDPASTSFIAVAHDIHEQTVRGYVQYMIDQARKYKYELVTVGECLGDPPNNWYRDSTSGREFGGPAPEKPKKTTISAPSTIPPQPSSTVPAGISTKPPQTVAASATPAPGPKSTGGSNSSPPASTSKTPKSSFARHNKSNSALGVFFGFLILLTWI